MLDKDRVLLREVLEKLDEILAILKQRPTVTWTPPLEGEWVVPDTAAGQVCLMGGMSERC